MKWTKLSLLMELFRLRGTIIDNNNAPTVQRSLLLRLPKEVMLYYFTKQPFCSDTSYTFTTNGYGKCGLHY
jgi:hypothetical protein